MNFHLHPVLASLVNKITFTSILSGVKIVQPISFVYHY